MPRRTNYELRSRRRRAGFGQRDLAALLGDKTTSRVSRYEKNRRLPALEVALAYEAILGVPLATLFGDVFERVKANVRREAKLLLGSMPPANALLAARRKRSIEQLLGDGT